MRTSDARQRTLPTMQMLQTHFFIAKPSLSHLSSRESLNKTSMVFILPLFSLQLFPSSPRFLHTPFAKHLVSKVPLKYEVKALSMQSYVYIYIYFIYIFIFPKSGDKRNCTAQTAQQLSRQLAMPKLSHQLVTLQSEQSKLWSRQVNNTHTQSSALQNKCNNRASCMRDSTASWMTQPGKKKKKLQFVCLVPYDIKSYLKLFLSVNLPEST